MEPFLIHAGVGAALLRPNIDTDAIIPSREMRSVSKTGLADGLFANWRYSDAATRTEDPAFILNQPRFRGASVLVGGPNFGCGSSREHAVWALREYGVRCVIAPSFGAIFRGNCVRNGLLPAEAAQETVDALAAALDRAADPTLSVDLVRRTIAGPDSLAFGFSVPDPDREMLMEALDGVGVTLKRMPLIEAFEARHRPRRPWLFRSLSGS